MLGHKRKMPEKTENEGYKQTALQRRGPRQASTKRLTSGRPGSHSLERVEGPVTIVVGTRSFKDPPNPKTPILEWEKIKKASSPWQGGRRQGGISMRARYFVHEQNLQS